MPPRPVELDVPARLLGRREERLRLDRLLAGVRSGSGHVLVLHGEPGMGKSALLDYLTQRATGCRVARAAGVESEVELTLAGVQQLLGPSLIEGADELPAPQREALRRAFGMTPGPPPDLFFVGLAVLGVFAHLAEDRPLICVIDDEHWLDRSSARVLAFVARRLHAEAVGLIFASRAPSDELGGLPEMHVSGLESPDATALLDSVLTGPIDERVREQILSESRGNPLALLELPRGRTPAELAGGFGLPRAVSLVGRIEQTFRRELASLPTGTRRLLQLAAADPTGEPLLLWRAAERLGLDPTAATPGVEAGLVDFDARVRFRHPLVRSAAYTSASLHERQRAHRALAEATDPELDPDRRAWHFAQAVHGPNEEVAAGLENSAERARARGGIAAAAAFLGRAVTLTADPRERGRRAVAAAEATMASGSPKEARELMSLAEQSPLDEHLLAKVDVIRALLAFSVHRGRDAPSLLLAAAKRLEPLDAESARETYMDAIHAAMYAGRFSEVPAVDVARAARNAPPASQPPRAVDLLLDGVATLLTEGYVAGATLLERALAAFADSDMRVDHLLRWGDTACHAASMLWDARWGTIAGRMVRSSRELGAGSALPLALTVECGWRLQMGEFESVSALVHELDVVAEATGTERPSLDAAAVAAWRGEEPAARALLQRMRSDAIGRGEGLVITYLDWVSAKLYNGLGRYAEALEVATSAYEHPADMWSPLWIHELVEAAVRGGDRERAEAVLEDFSAMATAAGTDKALGLLACSQALVDDDEHTDRLYREALDRLGRTPERIHLARAHLLYGEWLRRENRRVDARQQLRTANEMLTAMGMCAFAERARLELQATGEKVRRRSVETRDDLTAQERQIARLAREGRTNQEIGAQLFLSHRTVEWHLRNVFAKLGIASRKELKQALEGSEAEADAGLTASA